MEEGGGNKSPESEDGEGGGRCWKKVRKVSEVGSIVMEEGSGKFEGPSFKEKLVGLEFGACKKDTRGSCILDDQDHMDNLKGFFCDSSENHQGKEGINCEESEEDDCVTIDISREEYERWCAPWKKSLIIKLLGKTIPLWGMKKSLDKIWKTAKEFKTRDLDNGYFVVSFEEEEDMNYVYQEGPWMIADHYLIVQRWVPNFDPRNGECNKKIAAWVRIPLLPLEFFNTAALRKIGARAGRTLKIDMITRSSERGRFARICVELDLQKWLRSAIKILGRKRVIEYEGLHLICFKCGKYGHHKDACPESTECKAERGEEVVLAKEDHSEREVEAIQSRGGTESNREVKEGMDGRGEDKILN